MRRIPKAIQPLLTRLVAFLGIFVIFSGLIGPRIIGSGILYRDGFAWYGGFGKGLLFALIAFALLVYRADIGVRLPHWKRQEGAWLAASLCSFVAAWISVDHLLAGHRTFAWLAAAHGFLFASVACALVGCFGLPALRQLVRAYRRQMLLALTAGIIFYGFLVLVYHLWALLSAAVLHALAWLLRLSGLTAAIIPPRTLLLTKFGITIAQSCSGIESIALFSGLYAVVGFIDWPRFNKRRLLLAFPLALLCLFGCNILRVYVLVIAGYYINPQLAFSLFHTYAGMIFFVLYSFAFWALAYRWLTAKQPE